MVSIGLFFAVVTLVVVLGHEVVRDLRSLSSAQNDDRSWNFSQLEVELLQVQTSAFAVVARPDADLKMFRQRYDIFYSRVQSLSHDALRQVFDQDADAEQFLRSATNFLDKTTPVVDGNDADLRSALPSILDDVEGLHPEIRQLALNSLTYFASAQGQRRDALFNTLIHLAIASVLLVLALLVVAVYLLRLYRKGERISRENQTMRSRLEAAVNSSLDAVLVFDTEGQLIEFNGSAEAMFGYQRADVLGRDVAELIVPQHLRRIYNRSMQKFLWTDEPKHLGDGRVRFSALRKSGEEFPVEFSIALAETQGARVFVSFVRDITQELQVEEDLKAARDKAQEGEQAKSKLLTVMSHEMRTPLNGILGSLEMIDQSSMDGQQKRHLRSIAVSGELLLSHVNDVLDLSSLAAGSRLRETDRFILQDLVQNVAESLLGNATARGNWLDVNILSENLPIVEGDKTALQQCLVNLVGNAIKFTRDGIVTIELEKLTQVDEYEIRVSDNGVGIAPENLSRIFEEFVTIDTAFARETSGTGLGLAITKRLIDEMGGEIEADSVLGEGSLFILRVPLQTVEEPKHVYQAKEEDIPEFPAGLHALVVDDNEINRMILTAMLEGMDFKVTQAEDGYQAIQQVSDCRFDVVLLDISMPGIDGIETLSRIRALERSWCFVPAIAVTAHASPKDHARILQGYFSALLLKPIEVAKVRHALAHAFGVDQGNAILIGRSDMAQDFIERFGMDKFRRFHSELRSECSDLIGQLEQSGDLTPSVRAHAHKLAGSAAVLGESALHALLQKLEEIPNPDWTADRVRILDEFRKILRKLVQIP